MKGAPQGLDASRGNWKGPLIACAVYALLMAVVPVAPIGSDASLYGVEIRNSMNQPWDAHILWNFAHLLWRPLGRLLTLALGSVVAPFFAGSLDVSIPFLLMLPNLLAGAVCAILVQRIVEKWTASFRVSLVTLVCFLGLNPVINYSRGESPYIIGLACLLGSIYLMAFSRRPSVVTALLAGAVAGIAPCLWIPFILSLPALMTADWFLNLRGPGAKADFRRMAWFCLGAAIIGVSCFAVGAAFAHVRSPAGFNAWIHESSPDARSQTALRMISGLVRGVYDTGAEGVWLKWYVFHDPYAKVKISEVLAAAFVRFSLFYAALAALLGLLLIGRKTRLLGFIALASIPHLLLAIAYESSSVERYIPLIPALILGLGCALSLKSQALWMRTALGVLWVIPLAANTLSAEERNVPHQLSLDPGRLAILQGLPLHSRLITLNGSDALFELSYEDPRNPLHERPLPTMSVVAGSMGSGIEYWRRDIACVALHIWAQHGEVWISDRVLASQPMRSWHWVDKDLAGLTWPQVQDFFGGFDHSQERATPDGFFLLPDTPATRERLAQQFPGGAPRCDAEGYAVTGAKSDAQ